MKAHGDIPLPRITGSLLAPYHGQEILVPFQPTHSLTRFADKTCLVLRELHVELHQTIADLLQLCLLLVQAALNFIVLCLCFSQLLALGCNQLGNSVLVKQPPEESIKITTMHQRRR
jgi:hypothetical protein